MTTQLAEVPEVSLDFLTGDSEIELDKATLDRAEKQIDRRDGRGIRIKAEPISNMFRKVAKLFPPY